LVEAFDANHIVTGIRPGEKINECLMTEDESRHAFDLSSYYMIWGTKENLGLRVKDGFRYTSDSNKEWLTVEQLREIVCQDYPMKKLFAGLRALEPKTIKSG
jgi:FlaA1/EpsC-like NDP-sugar epimerase